MRSLFQGNTQAEPQVILFFFFNLSLQSIIQIRAVAWFLILYFNGIKTIYLLTWVPTAPFDA